MAISLYFETSQKWLILHRGWIKLLWGRWGDLIVGFLFQRFPSLELVSLQFYILGHTLFSSTFVNEEWIWICTLAWWRRLSQLPGSSVLGFFADRNFTIISPLKTADEFFPKHELVIKWDRIEQWWAIFIK